eukprot:TRINITY_DN30984_c0_g1_i1.p1 TRINITY_DN30984_c0_g1~~TRINITY_DN30984_c0_g1_i1.p1  ORF type:complete len:562 (+),score=165.23 TRINITY_DN30984_c0_g1_i1:50-1687(+)
MRWGRRGEQDKLFVKPSEHAGDGWGGKVETVSEGPRFQLLPFNHCALSFQPILDGVFTDDGSCFERSVILRFIEKHGKNPTTGTPLSAAQLYPLKLHRSQNGSFVCPSTKKEFTDHTHVVAIKTSGNAYAFGAVQEMNIKCGNWQDLIDGTPFTRQDVVTIQDPHNLLEKRDTSRYFHVRSGAEVPPAPGAAQERDDLNVGAAAQRVLSVLSARGAKREKAEAAEPESSAPAASKILYTSETPFGGRFASAGVTSTAAAPLREDVKVGLSEEQIREEVYAVVRKQKAVAFARLETSLGDINVKLHCSAAPMTCDNFVKLAEKGYYNGTTFHRVIRNFMAQGGDPTGTGTGGESCWGKRFRDEVDTSRLRHDGKGVLAMANSGKDTNGSQFYITFKSAPHLDGKHTVFGRVVGGAAVLDEIAKVPTDSESDRPLKPLVVNRAVVYQSPFAAAEKLVRDSHDTEKQKREAEEKRLEELKGAERRAWFSAPQQKRKAEATAAGIGKYLPAEFTQKRRRVDDGSGEAPAALPPAPKPAQRTREWDFSDW